MKCGNDRGSVLMEFVIVLPIYLILLGFVFMLGEMSLHAVHLAASGDRTLAVTQGGNAWSVSDAKAYIAKAISPSREFENVDLDYSLTKEGGSAKASSFTDMTAGKVAESEPDFAGSWSWIVASTLKDDYALTPWTRGMVRTWANLEKMVKMTEPPKSLGSDTVLAKLFSGVGVGRVSMVSKDLGGVSKYAYYTLMRNGKGRKSYRSWGDGRIVDNKQTWKKKVADEKFLFDGDTDKHWYDSMKGLDQGKDASIEGPRPLYERYKTYGKLAD